MGNESLQNQGDGEKDAALGGTGVFGVIKSPTNEGATTTNGKDTMAENSLGLK